MKAASGSSQIDRRRVFRTYFGRNRTVRCRCSARRRKRPGPSNLPEKGDPRVRDLKFTEVGGGLKIEGSWKFPQGKEALVSPQMETFEYRQGTPAHYVLDFWLKQGSLTRSQFDAKKKNPQTAARQKQNERRRREKELKGKIASQKRMAEIDDTTRFYAKSLSPIKMT